MSEHRLLLVHAHPDDECIGTGAVMAMYADRGVGVTLVTCTLGEEGEILVAEHAHRAADRDDSLAEIRHRELADAMRVLGVTDWRLLGQPGKYRDSGMIGTAANDRADSFWQADLLAAAIDLVMVIRQVRPQVVVTYDDFGGYGHPDHIQAHRVTTYAVALAAVGSFHPDLGEAWTVTKVYWTAIPKAMMRAGIEALRAAGDDTGFAAMDPDALPFGVEDSAITTAVDATSYLDRKMAALACHATQVQTDGGFFALSNNLGSKAMGVEHFRLAQGQARAPFDDNGWETDLFNGI